MLDLKQLAINYCTEVQHCRYGKAVHSKDNIKPSIALKCSDPSSSTYQVNCGRLISS